MSANAHAKLLETTVEIGEESPINRYRVLANGILDPFVKAKET